MLPVLQLPLHPTPAQSCRHLRPAAPSFCQSKSTAPCMPTQHMQASHQEGCSRGRAILAAATASQAPCVASQMPTCCCWRTLLELHVEDASLVRGSSRCRMSTARCVSRRSGAAALLTSAPQHHDPLYSHPLNLGVVCSLRKAAVFAEQPSRSTTRTASTSARCCLRHHSDRRCFSALCSWPADHQVPHR